MADGTTVGSDAGHVFLAAIVAPSALLSESAFIELKLSATVVRQVGEFLFIADSEAGAFPDIDELVDEISTVNLTPLLAGPKSRLTAMAASNSDIGHRALRSRSHSGYNLGESSPYLADHQYVLRRVQGYVEREHRSVGIARSRLAVGRGELVSLEEFSQWTRDIALALQSPNRTSIPYIDRFSQPIDAPDPSSAVPLHILLDIESLVDRFEHPEYTGLDIAEATGLASEVQEVGGKEAGTAPYAFNIRVFEEDRRVYLRYLPKRARYELESKFLDEFVNVSKPSESLLQKLNAQQAFRIIPAVAGTMYVGKRFLHTDLTVAPGGRGQFLLDLLYPVSLLEHAKSEKGKMRSAPAGHWQSGSLFDVIDRGLRGDLGQPFLSDRFDLLACTDLGREISDFVAVDTQRSRLVFIHAKAGESLFSVSSLHVVVAQAIKNLDNVAARSSRLPRELQIVKSSWKLEGRSRDRIRAGTPARFLAEAIRVSSAPDSQREVWLVLGSLLSKSKAETKIRAGSTSAELVQMFMLLSSLYTQCASVGSNLRVFCSP
jgi:hypothetical protein